MTKIWKTKIKSYKKLPLQNVLEFFAVININIKTPYKFNKNTKIMLLDQENNTTMLFNKIDQKLCKRLNSINQIYQGSYIFDNLNLLGK